MKNIIRLAYKMLHRTKFVAALEDQNVLLRDKLNIVETQKEDDEESKYIRRSKSYLRPVNDMDTFVNEHYEVRHNVVTDVYEYRSKADGKEAPFKVVDENELNSVAIEVQHAGIFTLDRFVKRLFKSNFAYKYHPVTTYLNSVRGIWDGKDRTASLLQRINMSDYALNMGRIWLRAIVAQYLGIDKSHANSVMLMLVSTAQGKNKSTFLRKLLPPALQDYYTDDFSLNMKGNAQRKMVEFAIINVDEFDKEDPKKMPALKTLMQTMKPSFIGAYKKNFNRLPRIASFTGTSNKRELLTDRTGSRRFLILEPDGNINTEGIEYDQLYAQLIYEVEHGKQYYFGAKEEKVMQEHNKTYYVHAPIENLFSNFFRKAKDGEKGMRMTAETILKHLSKHDTKITRGISPSQLGRHLRILQIPVHHSAMQNEYCVIPL